LEDFIKEAIKEGFTSYGISSHAPLPFSTAWTMEKDDVPAYLDEAYQLKEKYASQIELYIGMEIDFLNEESNPSMNYFRQMPLEYRIGSVHMLESLEGEIVDVDVSAEKFKDLLPKYFSNDLEATVRSYFRKTMRMVELGGFDIVGHADKMSFNALSCKPDLYDEDWYNSLLREYFSLIAEKGYMVQINSKAYHKLGIFYPNRKYFPLLKELNIPVQVNSDAHFPELINNGRPEALQALKEAGITTVRELHNGKWEDCLIG